LGNYWCCILVYVTTCPKFFVHLFYKEEKIITYKQIAIAALKFSILQVAPGKNVDFDPDTALSFEGDSGPYLQYSVARAHSVLHKADEKGITLSVTGSENELNFEISNLEKMLYRFPEIVARAGEEYAPQILTTYLTELAGTFNSWYGANVIVSNEVQAPYRVALTKAFTHVMTNGLHILAIPVPERM